MPRPTGADELKLCAQAMPGGDARCTVPEGALYGETRRRVLVSFSAELREMVRAMLEEMHRLLPPGIHAQGPALQVLQRLLPEGALPARPDEGDDVETYLRCAMEVEP